MGTVHQFKRPPKNERQFKGYRPEPPKPPRGPRWWQRSWVMWALLIAIAVLLAIVATGLAVIINRRLPT